MNSFSQITADCKEFAVIPITALSMGLISLYVLNKGINMTAATATSSRVAGLALAIFSAKLLFSSMIYLRCVTYFTPTHRLAFRNRSDLRYIRSMVPDSFQALHLASTIDEMLGTPPPKEANWNTWDNFHMCSIVIKMILKETFFLNTDSTVRKG